MDCAQIISILESENPSLTGKVFGRAAYESHKAGGFSTVPAIYVLRGEELLDEMVNPVSGSNTLVQTVSEQILIRVILDNTLIIEEQNGNAAQDVLDNYRNILFRTLLNRTTQNDGFWYYGGARRQTSDEHRLNWEFEFRRRVQLDWTDGYMDGVSDELVSIHSSYSLVEADESTHPNITSQTLFS